MFRERLIIKLSKNAEKTLTNFKGKSPDSLISLFTLSAPIVMGVVVALPSIVVSVGLGGIGGLLTIPMSVFINNESRENYFINECSKVAE